MARAAITPITQVLNVGSDATPTAINTTDDMIVSMANRRWDKMLILIENTNGSERYVSFSASAGFPTDAGIRAGLGDLGNGTTTIAVAATTGRQSFVLEGARFQQLQSATAGLDQALYINFSASFAGNITVFLLP